MPAAKKGDTVKVEYTGKFEDGTVFDSSDQSQPLEFTLGQGQVIPGFESNIEGMEAEQEKSFEIEPKDGYGEIQPDLSKTFPRNQLPDSIKPEIGMHLQMTMPNGREIPVQISAMDDENITIDANHPLAGKKLLFDIKLLEVK